MTTATKSGKSLLKPSAASLLLSVLMDNTLRGKRAPPRTGPDWEAPHSLKAGSATDEGWDPGQACGARTLASTSGRQGGSEEGSAHPGTRRSVGATWEVLSGRIFLNDFILQRQHEGL